MKHESVDALEGQLFAVQTMISTVETEEFEASLCLKRPGLADSVRRDAERARADAVSRLTKLSHRMRSLKLKIAFAKKREAKSGCAQ